MSTVGLDLGTTGVRAVGYDDHGVEVAAASRHTLLERPREGWVVFDAEAVLLSSESVIAEVATRAAAAGNPVEAIGFSSQGEAVVPVDSHGHALALAPVTMDARGGPAAAAVADRLGFERVQSITGQPLHQMFSLYKIAVGDQSWRPPAAAGYRTLADFVASRWGAAPATDWTSAARTGLFDVRTCTWSGELTAALAEESPWVAELPISEPVAPGTLLGPVSDGAAQRLNVRTGTQLVAGLHDQAASFVGAGGRAHEVSTFALGSSDCLTVETNGRPPGAAGTGFATYPWRPGRWLTLAGTAAGGWALDWYASLSGAADPTKLVADMAASPPAIIVLPYLAGSGTYDNDPTGRGAIIGLTLSHTRRDLTRAFVEAAGYELGLLVNALAVAGVDVGKVRAVGTGAVDTAVLTVRASAAGLPLGPVMGRASARGVALLAAAGLGRLDLDDLPPIDLGPTVKPEPNTALWYGHQRQAYRELYQSLRPFNSDLTTIHNERTPQ